MRVRETQRPETAPIIISEIVFKTFIQGKMNHIKREARKRTANQNQYTIPRIHTQYIYIKSTNLLATASFASQIRVAVYIQMWDPLEMGKVAPKHKRGRNENETRQKLNDYIN